MVNEQDLNELNSQQKEFQDLLVKDFAKRTVKEGQIIKAVVTEITQNS